MHPRHRIAALAAALSATALLAGCDSLPELPHIDLSGIFDGNHGAPKSASLDVIQSEPDLTLRFHKLTLKDTSIDLASNEITLRFNGEADAQVIADIQRSAPDWIAGTHANGDTATIVASKDVEFSTAAAPDGFDLTLKPRAVAGAVPDAAPTVSVEAESLPGDDQDNGGGGPIDGLQREDLRIAFGVNDNTNPTDGGL